MPPSYQQCHLTNTCLAWSPEEEERQQMPSKLHHPSSASLARRTHKKKETSASKENKPEPCFKLMATTWHMQPHPLNVYMASPSLGLIKNMPDSLPTEQKEVSESIIRREYKGTSKLHFSSLVGGDCVNSTLCCCCWSITQSSKGKKLVQLLEALITMLVYYLLVQIRSQSNRDLLDLKTVHWERLVTCGLIFPFKFSGLATRILECQL